MKFGIVGCGFVSDSYLATLKSYPEIAIVGCYDLEEGRMRKLAELGGFRKFATLDEMLSCKDVDAVINLTNPRVHHPVTKACLQAGKHVYSEKPIGMTTDQAEELIALAAEAGVRLATAPCSVLSPAAQTMWKAIRDGAVGKVRLVYANFDDGMIAPFMKPWNWKNSIDAPWPAKDEFEVGCTYEHAGYYLSWLCSFFGSVRRVTAYSGCLIPEKGIRVESMAPDFTSGVLEFDEGVVARVTCGLVAPLDKSMTVIGDDGVLFLKNLRDDLGTVWLTPRELTRGAARARNALARAREFMGSVVPAEWTSRLDVTGARKLPLIGDKRGVPGSPIHKRADFLRGPAELAASVAANRPCRLPGELGAHMVDIIEGLQSPVAGGKDLQTSVSRLEPIP